MSQTQNVLRFHLRPALSAVGLVFIYFLLRLLFLIHNPVTNTEDLLLLFVQGLRFDLSALALLNGVFLACYFFVLPWTCSPRARKIFGVTYFLTNALFVAANVVDTYYFPFSGKRTTIGIFALHHDLSNQASQLLVHFWTVPVLAFVLGGILFLLEKIWNKSLYGSAQFKIKSLGEMLAKPSIPFRFGEHVRPLTVYGTAALFWCALVVLIGRGGIGRKPLGLASAYEHVQAEQAPAVLNSTFSFLKSIGNSSLPFFEYLPRPVWEKWEQARKNSILSHFEKQALPTGSLKGQNVVVILLESFAMEYMGNPDSGRPCYMPFVCELSKKSLFFDRAFANGRTSIESFYSVFANLPSIHDQPLVVSEYGANRVPGLPQRLAEEGYKTAFFHGGQNGTMFFDVMARAVGFNSYYGANEYTGPATDDDGVWGIFDGPFLDFFAQTISQFPQPFMASVFTLSSHNPYTIPEAYKNRFSKGTLPIHESIGYTDETLRLFFEKAAQQPWFANTLFVLTADHAALSDDPQFENLPGHYRIPILYFHGSQSAAFDFLRPGRPQHLLTQQIDIAPTVVDLLGLPPGGESFFGTSVFARNQPRTVLGRSGEEFWALSGESLFQFMQTKTKVTPLKKFLSPLEVPLSEMKDPRHTQKNEPDDAMGLVQSFFNGLVGNTLNRFSVQEDPDP